MTVAIEELQVADSSDSWRSAGFTVDDDAVCRIGSLRVRLLGQGSGIVGWSLRGVPADGHIDGIPTSATEIPAPPSRPRIPTA